MCEYNLQGTKQAREAFLLDYLWGNLPSIKHSLESNSGGYVEPNQVTPSTWVQLDWVYGDTVHPTRHNGPAQ